MEAAIEAGKTEWLARGGVGGRHGGRRRPCRALTAIEDQSGRGRV